MTIGTEFLTSPADKYILLADHLTQGFPNFLMILQGFCLGCVILPKVILTTNSSPKLCQSIRSSPIKEIYFLSNSNHIYAKILIIFVVDRKRIPRSRTRKQNTRCTVCRFSSSPLRMLWSIDFCLIYIFTYIENQITLWFGNH